MRQSTEGEFDAYLGLQNRQYFYNVMVMDSAGVWTDLADLYGRDFVKSLSIDESQDSPSRQCDLTVQRRFDTVELTPPTGSNWDQPGILALDNLLQVWTRIGITGTVFPPLKVFEGRINSVDPGGDEVKVVARDACHDLTQVYIAPGMVVSAPATQAPQPGGDEEYEVIIG